MFTYPLTPYRGDTFRRQFSFFADHDHAVLSDLTGVDVAAEIRTAPGAAVITTIGLTVTLPNLIDLELTPAQTALLPPASSWDLQFTYPSGDVITVVRGSVSASGDITNSIAVGGMR